MTEETNNIPQVGDIVYINFDLAGTIKEIYPNDFRNGSKIVLHINTNIEDLNDDFKNKDAKNEHLKKLYRTIPLSKDSVWRKQDEILLDFFGASAYVSRVFVIETNITEDTITLQIKVI